MIFQILEEPELVHEKHEMGLAGISPQGESSQKARTVSKPNHAASCLQKGE
jgi:hypothetical protein